MYIYIYYIYIYISHHFLTSNGDIHGNHGVELGSVSIKGTSQFFHGEFMSDKVNTLTQKESILSSSKLIRLCRGCVTSQGCVYMYLHLKGNTCK